MNGGPPKHMSASLSLEAVLLSLAKDVIKDLEKRNLSWIVCVSRKCSHMPYKKEADSFEMDKAEALRWA